LSIVIVVLASGILTALLIWGLLRTGLASRWMDVPVDRSLHAVPTPRVGGLALCTAVTAVCWAWDAMRVSGPLWASLALVFAVSVIDDKRALPAGVRLTVHLAAALTWSQAYLGSFWAILPACLVLVWMANLYNFMDGVDGLAGGMAVVGFAALGSIALHENHAMALPAFVIAGASCGFLLYNFPPARLFLGDAGSVPLGFMAGAFALWGMVDGLWTHWVPAWIFAPFIVDASMTLVLRIFRRQKPWQAHREHLYQLCVLRGWSHRRLLAVAYPLMLVCAIWAVWLQRQPVADQQLWGLASCLSLATVYGLVRARVAREPAISQ
jgi:UDP-N-acetylmuramyl pentapeptide phosphotransferase/UDP-N-acetylglucosamine-1-phosphate transferase